MKPSKIDTLILTGAFLCATIVFSQSISFSMPPDEPRGTFDAFRYLGRHAWLLASCGGGLMFLTLLFIRLQKQVLRLQQLVGQGQRPLAAVGAASATQPDRARGSGAFGV